MSRINHRAIILVLVLSPFILYSQRRHPIRSVNPYPRLYLLGGGSIDGVPYTYHFATGGNYLRRGWLIPDGYTGGGNSLGLSAALQYRYSSKSAFEAGVKLHATFLMLYDKYFMEKNGIKGNEFDSQVDQPQANQGNFLSACDYSSYHLSYYHFFPTFRKTDFYVNTGLALNRTSDQISQFATYTYPTTNEQLDLSIHYNPLYLSGFIEGGIHIHPRIDKKPEGSGPVYFIGLTYFYSGNVITGDYTNSKNGIVNYTDHFASKGDYLALTIKIGGPILGKLVSKESHSKSKKKSKNKSSKKTKGKQSTPPIDHSNTRGW